MIAVAIHKCEKMEQPNPTREELRARCQQAIRVARSRRMPPKRKVVTAKPAAEAAAQLAQIPPEAIPDMPPVSEAVLKEYERDLIGICKGDINKFCELRGIDKSLVPAIKNGIERMRSGVDFRTNIARVAQEVNKQ